MHHIFATYKRDVLIYYWIIIVEPILTWCAGSVMCLIWYTFWSTWLLLTDTTQTMLTNSTQRAFKAYHTWDVLHNLHTIGVPVKVASNWKWLFILTYQVKVWVWHTRNSTLQGMALEKNNQQQWWRANPGSRLLPNTCTWWSVLFFLHHI